MWFKVIINQKVKMLVSRYQSENTAYMEIDPPFNGGAGGTGIFFLPQVGTKVLCIKSPFSSDQTFCIGIIPNELLKELQGNPFSKEALNPKADSPPNKGVYPTLNSDSDLCIQSDHGSGLYFYEGYSYLKDKNDCGIQILSSSEENGDESSMFVFSSNLVKATNSYKSYNGFLRRFKGGGLNRLSGERQENPFDLDKTYFDRTKTIGLFTKYPYKQISKYGLPRNVARVEGKHRVNEFSDEFIGFDIEKNHLTIREIEAEIFILMILIQKELKDL